MATILLLNGPNLNMLGQREPEKYGYTTLEQINQQVADILQKAGHQFTAYQSNAESDLIDYIHNAHVDLIIINPAAFTHTSVALRDALLAIRTPLIELHMTNIYTREPFRHHSYFSDIAIGTITGFGSKSYELAALAACDFFNQPIKNQ